MPRKQCRWYFRFPGSPHANGPTDGRAGSERAARRLLKEELGKKPPRGTEIWRAEGTCR